MSIPNFNFNQKAMLKLKIIKNISKFKCKFCRVHNKRLFVPKSLICQWAISQKDLLFLSLNSDWNQNTRRII